MDTPPRPLRPMPDQHVVLELDGVIAPEHVDLLTGGYTPRSAEDKWTIVYADRFLSFYRTATGACIFRLTLHPHDDHHIAPTVAVNRDPQQYRSLGDAYDIELLAYLIDRYLLGRNPPFPEPPRLNPTQRRQHHAHVIGREPASGNGFIRLDSLDG